MRVLVLTLLLLCAAGAWAAKQGPHGPIQLDCARCHSTSGWSLRTDAAFDHDVDTAFPLEGSHRLVACGSCHLDNHFTDTGSACVECHQDPHQGSLGGSCSDCHSPERWLDRARMQARHEGSQFPLTGAHRLVDCGLCHTGSGAGQFAATPTECSSCHQGDYLATRSPDHRAGGLTGPCSSCHSTNRWSGAGDFLHNSFPLSGAHTNEACSSCHQGNRFDTAPRDCSGCHQAAWEGSLNPRHASAQLGLDCARCHQDTGWRPGLFEHAQETGFALEGSHVGAACTACHQQEVYAGTASTCASCHLSDYQLALDPPHLEQGYPTDCALCHSESVWSGITFDHQTTGFSLNGAHGTALCSSCHPGGETSSTPSDCWSCHLADYQGSLEPAHEAGLFPQDCRGCHNETAWSPSSLDHQATAFPLLGSHATVGCAECHSAGQFSGNPTDCWSCHQPDYLESSEPAHQAGLFPEDCTLCHDETDWESSTLNHDLTDFPLTGAHITVGCADCHSAGQFSGNPTDCWGCHEPDFRESSEPDHESNLFSESCTDCHDTRAWVPSTFDHTLSDFPLTGAHSTTSCVDCHLGGQYLDLPAACWSCHEPDYRGSDNPDHELNLISQSCEECHSTAAWLPSTFDHALTTFPLSGAHQGTSCISCHVGGQYIDLPGACWDCHEPDFRDADDPDHEQNLFSQSCTDCHNTTAWQPSTFSHELTDFPLTGAHAGTSCISCHTGGQYVEIPGDCWSCHQSDYQQSDNPDHAQNQFSQSCTDCHNTTAWVPSTFSHELTDFPLTGAHGAVACASCHVGGQYIDLPGACWDCHEPDFQAADDPDHAQNQFSQSCTDCHNTTAWVPSTFDHALTDFPLTGAHGAVACATCHVGGQYIDLPGACWNCHEDDFQAADDPDHAQNQFSQSCTDCHNTTAWVPSTFDHALTDFPLTGAHGAVACATCHVGGQYNDLPSDCWSCHQDEFQGVANPNHVTGNYPHDCTVCHSTTQWDGASFNHNSTDFPLTGAHVGVSCALCHVDGQYENTPTDCFFCHEGDYQDAASPEHESHGYPTDCASCHSTAAGWNSSFNHATYFPIYTGQHRNEWTTCASCHLDNDLTDFSCTHCHEHRQSEMDDEHPSDEVPDYVWESHACLSCHPNGSELRHQFQRRESQDLRFKEPLR